MCDSAVFKAFYSKQVKTNHGSLGIREEKTHLGSMPTSYNGGKAPTVCLGIIFVTLLLK